MGMISSYTKGMGVVDGLDAGRLAEVLPAGSRLGDGEFFCLA